MLSPRGASTLRLNLRGARGPLCRQGYHALKTVIRDGRLGPAARLPSTRGLAADLGTSRNTVMLAYEQLAAEGYVVSRQRSTTSVAGTALPRTRAAPSSPTIVGAPQISSYARRLTKDPAATARSRPSISPREPCSTPATAWSSRTRTIPGPP